MRFCQYSSILDKDFDNNVNFITLEYLFALSFGSFYTVLYRRILEGKQKGD